MKRAVVILVSVAILAVGWFFASPLFIDEIVDESFNFALEGGGVDMKSVMAMPENKRLSMKQAIMDAAAAAPDLPSAEPMPSDAPIALARGRFTDADAVHKGSGQATLYRLPDNRHLVRFEDFRTTNGPALVVYLAKHASPKRASDVTDGGFIHLGELKGNVGNQNYDVPADVDVSEYNSVVIWCELFGVLFSPADLSPHKS
jgi:hypothetical protein